MGPQDDIESSIRLVCCVEGMTNGFESAANTVANNRVANGLGHNETETPRSIRAGTDRIRGDRSGRRTPTAANDPLIVGGADEPLGSSQHRT